MYILKYSDYLVPVHDPVNKPTTQCTYHHIQCTLQHTATLCSLQPLHLQCTHYSSHYIFSAHTTAAITSSVHTLQKPLHLQCTYYSSHCIFSAHCNHVQPSFNAHCSQLQPSTTYTTAIPFSAHCSHTT